MKDKVASLNIIGRNENIFDINGKYVIPLYQRAYAWEEKQLFQLIEDINDIPAGATYYIGSLVVSKHGDSYEVVDGQQRLTSLYLLMSCLGQSLRCTLSFACRAKSNYTLEKIHELIDENLSNYDADNIEKSIEDGIHILRQKIKEDDIDPEDLLTKLSRVVIYRIEVPENTDLNRYFEIMNTRGEQLEQHDILKATLMSYLNERDKSIFARIWDACSDMTGYVQMHFDKPTREKIFGTEWGGLPSNKWSDYRGILEYDGTEGSGDTIKKIINPNFQIPIYDVIDEEGNRIRFESIIEFPFFLLHAIRVFSSINEITSRDNEELLNDLLDDKKLISNFTDIVKKGVWRGKRIGENEKTKQDFSRMFVLCLLRCRYVFDKYVIKREFDSDNSDGEWSLKELCVSVQQRKKNPYYRNTQFKRAGEWATTYEPRTREVIMLQAALRVSYTSPKVMHWITQLLVMLCEADSVYITNEALVSFGSDIEEIIKAAVKSNFFDICEDGDYAMGVNTPHIVFNYLDYLLWKRDKKKYDDFEFEFRNSVEHWYPQHPSEGTFDQWSDGVDRFGNLCIIQRRINSRFSNMSPGGKKSTFGDTIKKGSLKLRIMSELTTDKGQKSASNYWKDEVCSQHEQKMIGILEKACFGE